MNVGGSGGKVVVWAPAKINLFLEILFRRDDGYHELETLMTAINVFDTLYFAADPSAELRLTVDHSYGYRARERAFRSPLGKVPVGNDNTVFRAVELLQRRAGVNSGAKMHLVKRIPTAAGLGGASSDAAAALLAANIGWDLGWSRPRLTALAAELGSDVPFFLFGRAAICSGRGEVVHPVESIGSLSFVVVRPAEGLRTEQVYANCQPPPKPFSIASAWEGTSRQRAVDVSRSLFNRLQPAAADLSPSIERLRNEFHRVDVLGHQMSGSGTSYFGVCRHARHAERIARRLRARRLGYVIRASSSGSGLHVQRLTCQN